jgi:hypothetical protein
LKSSKNRLAARKKERPGRETEKKENTTQQHHRGCGKEKLGLKRKNELEITFFWWRAFKVYMPRNRG